MLRLIGVSSATIACSIAIGSSWREIAEPSNRLVLKFSNPFMSSVSQNLFFSARTVSREGTEPRRTEMEVVILNPSSWRLGAFARDRQIFAYQV